MQMNTISRTISNKKAKVVGRGGARGKTSGRGGKGQTARAGNKTRPQMRDIIKKLPKLRGRGKNSNKSITEKPVVVTLATLEKIFDTGSRINPSVLLEKRLISRTQGVLPAVKILATGTLTKKLIVTSECLVSAAARVQIEAVGGKVY